MRKNHLPTIICLIIFLIVPGFVCAYSTPESIVAAGKVYVSSVTYDPETFFSGDSGTVTVNVANGNNNQSIVVNHVTFGDKNIRLISTPYDSSSNIGPLQVRPFIFSVTADASEGIYYPTFSLSFRDADSLYYRAMIEVDDTPLELTVVEKPDAFASGKKKTVYMQVANPRKNTVKNIMLQVSGSGITTTPSKTFIGNIDAGAKIPVNFTITPDQPTTAQLTLDYDNGNNPHTVTMDFPIIFGVDKKQANPVMSNVQVKNSAGIYHITGDVNNAGLETANTVMVTTLPPAVPQDPYKTYVVGALKPDDFGSFEITFTAMNTDSVPVQLTFKDADGNIYDTVQDVKLSASGSAAQKNDSGSPIIPVIAGIVLLLVFVGGWAYYLKRYKK